MVCPVTVVSFASQLLAIGTAVGAVAGTGAIAFLFNRASESELETNPQKKQKLQGKASRSAPAEVPKPSVVTRMKDVKLLRTLLAGPGRNVTATDRMLVLTMKELTLVFTRGAEGAMVATLASGDAKLARQVLEDAQTRYIASVREGVRERVRAEAPRAGWKVAAQEIARDGSAQITLQKSRPKQPVAIG